jgi:hypothetical protein
MLWRGKPVQVELKEANMGEQQLTLTAEERQYLVGLLENTLKVTLVEEHRTRAPSYREHVLHNEEIIQAVLKKLQQSPT